MSNILTQVALMGGLTAAPAGDCVVLLHGLARRATSFLIMEKTLESVGYHVVNVNYPSTKARIEELSLSAIPKALAQCDGAKNIHFVTHSMGGILVRYFLSDPARKPANLGRVVMLAPPNKGSAVVDQIGDLPGFDLWNGEAGGQLGTEETSIPNTLGDADFDLGIIAGTRSISPIMSSMIDGDNDGKVSVDSTKLNGMRDHLSMHVSHTFIMNSPNVIKQVAHYLVNGQFDHTAN